MNHPVRKRRMKDHFSSQLQTAPVPFRNASSQSAVEEGRALIRDLREAIAMSYAAADAAKGYAEAAEMEARRIVARGGSDHNARPGISTQSSQLSADSFDDIDGAIAESRAFSGKARAENAAGRALVEATQAEVEAAASMEQLCVTLSRLIR